MQTIVNKLWGYEIWIENNHLYCGKHIHIVPHRTCSVHYHKNKKETFYVINGSLLIETSTVLDKSSWLNNSNIKVTRLDKGQSYTIDTYIAHRFKSALDYPCDFIEISTHHDDNDSYRIIESK